MCICIHICICSTCRYICIYIFFLFTIFRMSSKGQHCGASFCFAASLAKVRRASCAESAALKSLINLSVVFQPLWQSGIQCSRAATGQVWSICCFSLCHWTGFRIGRERSSLIIQPGRRQLALHHCRKNSRRLSSCCHDTVPKSEACKWTTMTWTSSVAVQSR